MLTSVLRGTGNGDHVVHAHHQVGHDDGLDGRQQLVAGLDVAMAVFIGGQQLHANPHQQQRAHKLEERQGQQRHGKRDQDHAQHDGASGAPDDALGTLGRRQLAAGQGNDYRVVATQQDVDDDDLAECEPEFGRCQKVHKFLNNNRQKDDLAATVAPRPSRG